MDSIRNVQWLMSGEWGRRKKLSRRIGIELIKEVCLEPGKESSCVVDGRGPVMASDAG